MGEYLLNRGLYTPKQTASILNCTLRQVYQEIDAIPILGSGLVKHKKDQHSWADQHFYMQSQLLKDVDYMSMWHGLEVRVPFLDRFLVEVSHSITPNVKYNKLQKKHLLIKAFKDILPAEIYQGKSRVLLYHLRGGWFRFRPRTSGIAFLSKNTSSYNRASLRWAPYWGYLLTCHREKHTSLR
jgi:asparagine synthase (glutamine-hydrolysing)